MLPTVFVAHIAIYSPAARLGGQISVGDHVLSCNGASLVGLPLSECNTVLRVRLYQVTVSQVVVRLADTQGLWLPPCVLLASVSLYPLVWDWFPLPHPVFGACIVF